jgi:hypothetical protein
MSAESPNTFIPPSIESLILIIVSHDCACLHETCAVLKRQQQELLHYYPYTARTSHRHNSAAEKALKDAEVPWIQQQPRELFVDGIHQLVHQWVDRLNILSSIALTQPEKSANRVYLNKPYNTAFVQSKSKQSKKHKYTAVLTYWFSD